MKFISWLSGILAVTILLGACNKVPLVSSDKSNEPPFSDNSKVLLIVVDGMVGKEMGKTVTPEIEALLPNSIYSYEGTADTVTTDGASWAYIMTANAVGNNEIRDSSLTPRVERGNRYPSFISRVKGQKARPFRVVTVTPWDALNKTFFKDADVKISITGNNDVAVRDSAAARIKTDSADLLIAHFNSANIAGRAEGFLSSVPAYKTALQNIDSYIGTLVKSLKERPNFAKEDWLVIIQSTHGGRGKTYGSFLEEEKNTFTLYYNPSFKRKSVTSPLGIKYAVRLNGADANAVNAVLADNNAYNFGDKDNYTVEVKMRHAVAGTSVNYPAFLSKRPYFGAGQNGWCFFLEGNYWQINLSNTGSTSNTQAAGRQINDGRWHTLSAVFFTNTTVTPFKRYVKVFTDGIYNNVAEITARGNLNTTAPLTLGVTVPNNGAGANIYMSDLRIWKDSLPETVISSFSCTNVINESHPNYKDLIGYWKMDEGGGGKFINKILGAPDFQIRNAYKWDVMNYLLPCAGSVAGAAEPPYSSEVFSQIAYWLNIQVVNEWEMKGRLWLAQL